MVGGYGGAGHTKIHNQGLCGYALIVGHSNSQLTVWLATKPVVLVVVVDAFPSWRHMRRKRGGVRERHLAVQVRAQKHSAWPKKWRVTRTSNPDSSAMVDIFRAAAGGLRRGGVAPLNAAARETRTCTGQQIGGVGGEKGWGGVGVGGDQRWRCLHRDRTGLPPLH